MRTRVLVMFVGLALSACPRSAAPPSPPSTNAPAAPASSHADPASAVDAQASARRANITHPTSTARPDAAGDAQAQVAADRDAAAAAATTVTAGSPSGGFLDGDDAAILRRICDAPVERYERNRGGSTISFRTWFAGGARGLFKPQQRAEVANFRAELAAYRLSRLLGLHRVPPACGRALARHDLQRVADATGNAEFSERVLRELLGREDSVPGAMLYWVPGPLEDVPGTERWPALLDPAQPLAPADEPLAADMARLILFDFVTDNVDRWSGGNIKRQHLAGREPSAVLFMDNGAAFSAVNDGRGARPRDQADRLARVGRLPRAMVASLRALTPDALAAAMREDPLGPLLSPAQLRAVMARRDAVLAHVDALARARGGEAAVLVFP